MAPRGPKCPQCRKALPADSPALPFCSERCRLLDLGAWLDGRYVIAGRPQDQADEAGGDGGTKPPDEPVQ